MRDMSSDVDVSGRSSEPVREMVLRSRRTFAMPMRGHGPFSFWVTTAHRRPKKSMRLSL